MVALLGCSGSSASSECEELTAEQCMAPESTLVVDTAWLEERLGDPRVQVIDTRSSGYETSRIPGAIRLTPGDLSTTIEGVGGQLMPAVQAQPELRAAGLQNEAVAVVYGRSPEYDPARIVWALRYYGHEDVRYLDGGFDAWVDAGGELDSEPPDVPPTEYTIVSVDEDLRVEADWVLLQLGDEPYDMPAIQLIDARSSGEYGSGHIPSAQSVDWALNLDSGFLRSESELEALYEGLDPTTTTVAYCASGRRGSFAWLTLTALGYEDVRLYDGSWNEWGSGDFPVEQ
jgi:thiosulfate/3-mercaptopyruvate sulfurtransferase